MFVPSFYIKRIRLERALTSFGDVLEVSSRNVEFSSFDELRIANPRLRSVLSSRVLHALPPHTCSSWCRTTGAILCSAALSSSPLCLRDATRTFSVCATSPTRKSPTYAGFFRRRRSCRIFVDWRATYCSITYHGVKRAVVRYATIPRQQVTKFRVLDLQAFSQYPHFSCTTVGKFFILHDSR